MNYHKLFSAPAQPEPVHDAQPGDQRTGAVYLYPEQAELAVNVALAAGRPLLVRGPSGCGKSSLAPSVARIMGFRFLDQVITSRTQAQDLLWQVDHLQRLRDAQARELRPIGDYVRPGVLWWALDPAGARERAGAHPHQPRAGDPGDEARAVVLLDEIDKADPDVPNNLLVTLGSLQFTVEDTGEVVRARLDRAPVVILTTNDERELPQAFLRRCVTLVLEAPSAARMAEVGALHFPGADPGELLEIAKLVWANRRGEVPVSTAEYLDTVRACRQLQVKPGSEAWGRLLEITLSRHAPAGEAR